MSATPGPATVVLSVPVVVRAQAGYKLMRCSRHMLVMAGIVLGARSPLGHLLVQCANSLDRVGPESAWPL